MTEINSGQIKKDKMSLFDFLLEVYGFLRIIASPLLIASAIGLGIYIYDPNLVRLVIAIVLASIGLIIGIIWATKIWRRQGTMNYISTVMSSPDFDKLKEKEG